MSEKYKLMSRIWLSWGLVYPSGPTFRVGLGTLLVASGSHISAEDAHTELGTFQEEFRIIRGVRPTRGTLKEFPANATTYDVS